MNTLQSKISSKNMLSSKQIFFALIIQGMNATREMNFVAVALRGSHYRQDQLLLRSEFFIRVILNFKAGSSCKKVAANIYSFDCSFYKL